MGRKRLLLLIRVVVASVACLAPLAEAQTKPNILVIMGDDIGYWNLSTYNQGMMGYRTPNIDSIANEGKIHRCIRREQLHSRTFRVHYRPESVSDRAPESRPAGRKGRPQRQRSHARRVTQAARLHHRPIRKESPG